MFLLFLVLCFSCFLYLRLLISLLIIHDHFPIISNAINCTVEIMSLNNVRIYHSCLPVTESHCSVDWCVCVQACSVAQQMTPHTSAVASAPRDPQEMEPLAMTWMRLVHLHAICLSRELEMNIVLWGVTLHSPVEVYWHFRGTALNVCWSVLWHFPKSHTFNSPHCENCKYRFLFLNNLCGSSSSIYYTIPEAHLNNTQFLHHRNYIMFCMWGLRFSWWWLWRVLSSAVRRCMV
jgi:hypothetical protein